MSLTATPVCLIESAYAPSSAATQYTVPSNTTTIIDKFTATNSSGSTATLNIYLVPSGGSYGSSNLIIDALSITSGTTEDITSLQNQILAAGDFISVSASSGSAIVIRASGRQCA